MFRANSRKRLSGEFISPMLGAASNSKSSNEHLAHATSPRAKPEQDSAKRARIHTQVALPSTSKATNDIHALAPSDTTSFSLRRGPLKSHELEKRISELQAESSRLNDQIELFTQRGFNTEELDKHIKLLHEYNELKDVGSTLLGRLAFTKGISMNEVYKEYKLNLQD